MSLKNAPRRIVGGCRRRGEARPSARNILLQIEYDGTGYAGWQVQNRRQSSVFSRQEKTIQQVLEKSLQRILRERVHLVASGRTDAGVHAKAQAANFRTSSKIHPDKLRLALNGVLPGDITVISAEDKPASFHSRFDAKSKIYRYSILNRRWPGPLSRHFAYFYPHPLDVKLMRQEARVLLGRHDFKSFQAADKRERSAVKTIKGIKIAKNREGLVTIDIEADGFAYNMVRNIVGTMIEIGRGKLIRGDLKRILRLRDRRSAGPAAPARGLCLTRVNY